METSQSYKLQIAEFEGQLKVLQENAMRFEMCILSEVWCCIKMHTSRATTTVDPHNTHVDIDSACSFVKCFSHWQCTCVPWHL